MRKSTPHSAYQVFEDALALVGSFAKLGQSMAASKIQSTAETANEFIHSKIESADVSSHLANASDNLEHLTEYARNTDVKHMVEDVTLFARKHPVTAVISVIAVGALFSRLMMRSDAPAVIPPVKLRKAAVKKSKPRSVKVVAKSRRKANGTTQVHV